MTQHTLIIATGNAHKVEEFELLLDGLNFDVRSAKAWRMHSSRPRRCVRGHPKVLG